MKWSKEQQRVIDSNNKRILVSASAGSGKTTVMIERIKRLIEDGVSLKNMVICTFTKSAAADMKAKLYEKLAASGLSAAKDVATSDISTMHSFCQRLVKKYFYIIGIDPEFAIADEGESMRMRNLAINEAVNECYDEDFLQLCEYMQMGRRNSETVRIIDKLLLRKINRDDMEYEYDSLAVSEILEDYLDERKNILTEKVERLFFALDYPELENHLLSVLAGLEWENNLKKFKGDDAVYNECLSYLRAEVKDFSKLRTQLAQLPSQSISEKYIFSLLNVTEIAWQKYEEIKYKKSLVDFEDVETYAIRILESEVGDEIRRRYTHVFVDEYQDTNPLQEKLVEELSKDGNLFMVGDLKQSIYAFRGCDPSIFKNKRDILEFQGGEVIYLNTNYRSCKKVVEFTNDIFGQVMSYEFGGVSYRELLMVANKEEDGYARLHAIVGSSSRPKVSGIYSVKEHEEIESDDKISATATQVVGRVVELLATTCDGKFIRPEEIAILARSQDNKLMNLIVERLRKINVPVSRKDKIYFTDCEEVGQLLSFLRLIDNFNDDKSLMIAMLSPFGGFSENDLAGIKNSSFDAFHTVVKNSEREDVKAFLAKIDKYLELSYRVPVGELADIIVSDHAYFNYAFGHGAQAAEILDRFLEYLRGYSKSLYETLGFIAESKPYVDVTPNENAVKIMTVHGSKGLEFNYVIVVGMDGATSKPGNMISKLTMPVYENHSAIQSDLGYVSYLHEVKKDREEELRILYVALTRAIKGLDVFIRVSSDVADFFDVYQVFPELVSFEDAKNTAMWFAPQYVYALKDNIENIKFIDDGERTVLFGDGDAELVERLKKSFEFRPAPCAPQKSYVSRLSHDEAEEQPAIYLTSEENIGGDALQRGNAYHRAMEAIDFGNPDISVIAAEDIELIDTNHIFAAAARFAKIKGKVYKEKPFMIKLTAKEAGMSGQGNVLVQGVIDLLIIDGDDAVIVDYKTGKAHGSYEEGYFKQVNYYALAVQRLLNKNIAGKYLYYFYSDELVEVR